MQEEHTNLHSTIVSKGKSPSFLGNTLTAYANQQRRKQGDSTCHLREPAWFEGTAETPNQLLTKTLQMDT